MAERSRRLLPLAAVGLLLVAGCGSQRASRVDIAFVSTRDGDYAIYGMNADGSHERRLSPKQKRPDSSPARVFFQNEPAWSPDGGQLAFSSKRDGLTHIFVMGADGPGTHRLTPRTSQDASPSWSPDGRRIAFSRETPGDLYVIDIGTKVIRRVGRDDAEEHDPAWSPDGRWLAYDRRTPGTSSREIWLIRPDGSGRRQLTHLEALSQSPAWSPDGRRLAFSSDASGGRYAIFTVAVASGVVHRLTVPTDDSFEPAWSPDGKLIAYSRGGAIYTVDAAGTREDRLSDGKNDSSPAWRPPVAC